MTDNQKLYIWGSARVHDFDRWQYDDLDHEAYPRIAISRCNHHFTVWPHIARGVNNVAALIPQNEQRCKQCANRRKKGGRV